MWTIPRLSRLAVVVPVLVITMLASGCAPTVGSPTATPSPKSTPIFRSEKEALEAATKAYAAYVKVSDEITADGGKDPQRIQELVSPKQYIREKKAFLAFATENLSTTGSSKFDHVGLESFSDRRVVVYLCSDVTDVRVQNTAGIDVTSADRVNRQSFEVAFAATEHDPRSLIVSSNDPWEGEDVCS